MKRERTYSWLDPTEIAEKTKTMSGFDFLSQMKSFDSPIESTLEFKLTEVEKGQVTFEFMPREFHYNPIGTVHGGVISTVLDSAFGCAVHTLLEAGEGYTSLEIKLNFLRPITVASGKMTAVGKVINMGRRTALAEASLQDEQGKIYAHGTSTCMVFR